MACLQLVYDPINRIKTEVHGIISQVSKECGSTASIAVMCKVRSFSDFCKVFSVKFNQLHSADIDNRY